MKKFTNKQLQELLKQYPDDMPIKLLVDHDLKTKIQDFDEENILHSSETAYVDGDAEPMDWDCEDGKVELGEGQQYLLINPIIV